MALLAVGTVCTIDAVSSKFHGQRCTLSAYNRAKGKWRVQLEDRDKELLISAASLRVDDGEEPEEIDELEEVTPGMGGDLPSFEISVDSRESAWHQAASAALEKLGACVLKPAATSTLITAPVLERCRCDTRPRLDMLRGLAEAYRLSGAGDEGATANDLDRAQVEKMRIARQDGGLQFAQIYSRSDKEHRYDVTVLRGGAWVGGAEITGAASPGAEGAWRELLAQVDALVQPVLRGTPAFASAAEIESSGFLLSHPGAPLQQWHPDDATTVGLVTVFIPLIGLTAAHGPTELALGTHVESGRRVANDRLRYDYSPTPRSYPGKLVCPTLAAGSMLIFDWRTWHRGGANVSDVDRPVACIAYQARGVQVHNYKQGLPSLVPAGTEQPEGGHHSQDMPSPVERDNLNGDYRTRRRVVVATAVLGAALAIMAVAWRRGTSRVV